MEYLLNEIILGNTIQNYIITLVIFIGIILILRFFKYGIIRKLKTLSEKTKSDIDDFFIGLADSIGWPLYVIFSIQVSFQYLFLPALVKNIIYYLFIIILVFYSVKIVQKIIEYFSDKVVKKQEEAGKKPDTTIIDLFKKILKAIVWIIALLSVLAAFGINITGVVMGLGVSGIVIGFALQNVLVDVFASFSIYFDKPFEKGDFIVIGDDLGVVEKIGIRSTRIKHLKGHELVVSNTELTKIRINNYKKMKKRRISFEFGVLYETPTAKLKKIPEIVKNIIDKIKLAELDRVHFKNFGNSALIFEVVYYLKTANYNEYMDTQQEINIALKEEFEKNKIEFAYPTQTLYVNKMGIK